MTFADTHTVTIGEALGHDWEILETVPATCVTEGYTILECARCNGTQETKTGGACGHYYSAWMSNGDGTHTAFCLNCNGSRKANCDCRDGEVCFVCGSGEYDLIDGATATGEILPARGELCVRYAPDTGFLISWEYCGVPVPIPAPLTVSIPVEIEGDFAITGADCTYENGVLTLTIEDGVALAILR